MKFQTKNYCFGWWYGEPRDTLEEAISDARTLLSRKMEGVHVVQIENQQENKLDLILEPWPSTSERIHQSQLA